MPRPARMTLILNILIFLGLAYLNNISTAGHSFALNISDNLSTIGSENITTQSDNIPSPVQIADVDKQTGKQLRTESTVITLTPEQLAEIQRQIEEKKKLVYTSQIRFPSRYIINVSDGTIDGNIQDNGKTSDNDYYVIQFYTDMASVDKDTRDSLQRSGCILYNHISNNAFYAKIPPESLDTVISLVVAGKVRYLGHIPIEAKISPGLLAKTKENPNNSLNLTVQVFKDTSDSEINTLGRILQIDYHYYSKGDTFIFGETPASSIKDIIALSFVQWVEEESHLYFFNSDNTSEITEIREYLVVLGTMTAEYRNRLLAISNIKYIGDTNYIDTNNKKYPALVISTDPATAEEIKNLDFVIAVSPIDNTYASPNPPLNVETMKLTNTKLIITVITAIILFIIVIIIIYLRKRRSNQD
jgi:hypothetical protein